ncbi:hypothetical protein [Nocardia altamirensis]|uniref:hypothetical protein n=1 Tax=Nocardia altamirensis TaxID=472158 RepID=UPI00084041EF|nr:hypothetical protein [Nocardia altamirensis]
MTDNALPTAIGCSLVEVFHNVTFDAYGAPVPLTTRRYSADHQITEVFTARLSLDTEFVDPGDVAQRVFDLANEQPQLGDQALALAYQRRKLRLFAVGDLVRVDGVWLSCERSGWDLPASEPTVISEPAYPGWLPPSSWTSTPSTDPALTRDTVVVAPDCLRPGDTVLAIAEQPTPKPITVRAVVHRHAGFLEPAEHYPLGPTWELLSRNTSNPSRFLRELDYAHIPRSTQSATLGSRQEAGR